MIHEPDPHKWIPQINCGESYKTEKQLRVWIYSPILCLVTQKSCFVSIAGCCGRQSASPHRSTGSILRCSHGRTYHSVITFFYVKKADRVPPRKVTVTQWADIEWSGNKNRDLKFIRHVHSSISIRSYENTDCFIF